ncbi:MAG: PorV/PorQ family protein, partial [candidate division Zixibacteria bacterium]|nr:PorV/PorQ family protein [candidate division Zixibacteria bacterium]
MAKKFTRDSNPQRLARWIERVKRYNRLETDDVLPGQKLWLYTGPAGSRITAVFAGSDAVWLGTEFGVLKYNEREFERYEAAGLARVPTVDAQFKGADGFFATAEQVTIYARPWKMVGLMHSKWLPELAEDLFFDVPAYLQHFPGIGTFGLQVTFLSLGRNTRIGEAGDTLGFFDSFEGSIGVTYGARLSQSLSGGVTGKFILSKLASSGAGREIGKGQGTSFALDLGLLYNTPIKKLTLGAALTNLGPKLQFIDASQADPLPRNIAIGFSYKIIESAYNKLTLLADFNRDLVSRDTTINPFESVFNESIENFGIEYWYGSYFAGRMGYVYDPDGQLKYMTLGTSLQYRNFRFDLAYIPSSRNLALANT